MSDWPDQKIRSIAVSMILRASKVPATWRFTWIDRVHPAVSEKVVLWEEELPIVSCFISEVSWYVLTTRRILGFYSGQRYEAVPNQILDTYFGDFKGTAGQETELMRLKVPGGVALQLEYETGKASMAPIYYLRFWKYKYPILDRLRPDPSKNE